MIEQQALRILTETKRLGYQSYFAEANARYDYNCSRRHYIRRGFLDSLCGNCLAQPNALDIALINIRAANPRYVALPVTCVVSRWRASTDDLANIHNPAT